MKVIFIHIPKSAGSTFKSILNRAFPKTEQFYIKADDNGEVNVGSFLTLPEKDKKRIKLIYGHLGFGLHHRMQEDVKYVTILRNPIERVISHYYFVIRTPSHYLHRKVKKNKMTLKDYVSSTLTSELENGQLRMLTKVTNENCTQYDLDKAIYNIENFFISIGIQDKFDESMLLFKTKFKWKDYPLYFSKNVTTKKKEVTESVIKIIEERNQYDIKLYEWALDRFEKEINSILNIEYELNLFRELNKAFGLGHIEGYEVATRENIILRWKDKCRNILFPK